MITTPAPKVSLLGLVGLSLALAVLAPATAAADQDDPPTRVARLAYVEGSVSFQPGGTDDWVAPPVNRPLTTGDKLWSDRDGRIELQLDGSFLRLASNSAVSLLNIGDHVTQIQLSAGTLVVRVRRLDDDETYEIDTPNLAFSILRPGLYRLTVDDSGNTTAIAVRSGQGEVTGGGVAYAVRASEYDVFSGTDELAETQQGYVPGEDTFDAWSASRDSRWERSAAAAYVSPDVVGTEDLDDYGTWRPTPEYGTVWFPRAVATGWAPYHDGHWAYIEPWGYTWVDDSPWGYAPFHYGRWVSVQGAWGWVPAPPRRKGAVYVRPVYAPALVAWVGVGVGVAWFALGPREVYVPSYPVSRGYVHNINVSNTTVNTTVVNNIYNATVVNRTVNVTNVTYVNRGVPGAVVGTTTQAFASAQPVSRNIVRVDERAVASAQVRTFAPAAAPMRQAVLGTGRMTAIKPPAVVQTRVVVARTAPPPPPPAFERREEAIRNNAGRPLSAAQVRQVQASAAPQAAAVRIAPPARMIAAPTRTAAPPERSGATQARSPTAGTEAARSAPTPVPVHPNEIPMAPRPPSPSSTNTVLEQPRLQEQQRLHAQQEAERQRVQQQHDLEHQQLVKQQADEAQRRQVELQHQQQTELLMQKHAQEQQLLAKQQEQQRQQERQPLSQDRRGDRPPSSATEAVRPAPAPVHPNEIPVVPGPPSPSIANSVLERQHLQEQQQLHAQQQAERQRVQQQHDLEHQQLVKQQADEAQRRQVELQHQQQTQQLMQKHAQEQQQLLEKHQEQKRQQESQPPVKGRAADRPGDARP